MNIKNQHVYQQGNRSVQIVVYDPIIDEKQTQSQTLQPQATGRRKRAPPVKPLPSQATSTLNSSTTASPSPSPSTTIAVTTTQFIGGHGNHRFNITCKSIPTEGVDETVVHVFKGKYVL